MEENIKKAIVFDTNFVIEQHKSFIDIIKQLREIEGVDVFITEISIEERIAQKKLELSGIYEKTQQFKEQYSRYIEIEEKMPFAERLKNEEKKTRSVYEKVFGENIIPFNAGEDVLKTVLKRVNEKIPPFSKASNASDKGFKDTLIWLSIIEYFKNCEMNVVFITSDKIFKSCSDELKKEFEDKTKKSIDFCENDYYKTLLGEDLQEDKQVEIQSEYEITKDIEQLRGEIDNTVSNLCSYILPDGWGGYSKENRFGIQEKLISFSAQLFFEELKSFLQAHKFDLYVSPTDLLGEYVEIREYEDVSIDFVEEVYRLYQKIRENYREYLPQFFDTFCRIVNKNLIVDRPQSNIGIEDNEVPF